VGLLFLACVFIVLVVLLAVWYSSRRVPPKAKGLRRADDEHEGPPPSPLKDWSGKF
jgi:hypothetical protein